VGNKEHAKILLDEFFSYIIESSKRIKKFSRKFDKRKYPKKYLDNIINRLLPDILEDFKFLQKDFRTYNMMRNSEKNCGIRTEETWQKQMKIGNKLY
jgi:hypothetical protein